MHLDREDEWREELDDIKSSGGERLEFKSVGIDIGSSTSHLMFSRLVLARRGKDYFSGYTVIEREVVFSSSIILTPYLGPNGLIDQTSLGEFIQQAYSEAGITPDEVNTGAVIITGEAARRENAAAIIDLFAEEAGKFVCSIAGPNLEAVLAAYGSGAVKHSLKHTYHGDLTIFNVDIGGGTSKIAIVRDGRVLDTCVLNIGSRLVAWNAGGTLIRVEEAGAKIAASLGMEAKVGSSLTEEEKERLSDRLALTLFEVLRQEPLSPLARSLLLTPQLIYRGPIDLVVYSGGVSEFIYGNEENDFGDLGPWLGHHIRMEHERWGAPLGFPEERIRATVIGASQYTVQVSGNTIFISDPSSLPMRNLPVVKLPLADTSPTREVVASTIYQALRLIDIVEGRDKVALAIHWSQEPDYARLYELSAGIKLGLPNTIASHLPVVLVFDNDVGKLVGHLLDDLEVGNVVSIDAIDVRQLSYIDIGQELKETKAVPVTVKSLVFR